MITQSESTTELKHGSSLTVSYIPDQWFTSYGMDDVTYRLGVSQSTPHQSTVWLVPASVISAVTRLYELRPDRVEMQRTPSQQESLFFFFEYPTVPVPVGATDLSVTVIGVRILLPQGEFQPLVRWSTGGGYENAFADFGSIDAFIHLIAKSKTGYRRLGYEPVERRINFIF